MLAVVQSLPQDIPISTGPTPSFDDYILPDQTEPPISYNEVQSYTLDFEVLHLCPKSTEHTNLTSLQTGSDSQAHQNNLEMASLAMSPRRKPIRQPEPTPPKRRMTPPDTGENGSFGCVDELKHPACCQVLGKSFQCVVYFQDHKYCLFRKDWFCCDYISIDGVGVNCDRNGYLKRAHGGRIPLDQPSGTCRAPDYRNKEGDKDSCSDHE